MAMGEIIPIGIVITEAPLAEFFFRVTQMTEYRKLPKIFLLQHDFGIFASYL
jgi:hypothetical protein